MKAMALLFFVFLPQGDIAQTDDLGTILEPDPLVFTFETVGWKYLGILLLAIGVLLLVTYLRQYQKNKYKREAIKKVNHINGQTVSSQQKLNQVNVILKQVAIISFGRVQVANLYGDEWFSFLDSKHKTKGFAKYADTFKNALYSDKEVDEPTLEAISVITKKWINHHG